MGDPLTRPRACSRVAVVIVALLLSSAVGWADAERPVIEITPGKERAFHVAVQDFADTALPPDLERAARLREAVEAGLEFNGVLLPLARKALHGPQQTAELTSGRRYDCGDWSQSGADALVGVESWTLALVPDVGW